MCSWFLSKGSEHRMGKRLVCLNLLNSGDVKMLMGWQRWPKTQWKHCVHKGNCPVFASCWLLFMFDSWNIAGFVVSARWAAQEQRCGRREDPPLNNLDYGYCLWKCFCVTIFRECNLPLLFTENGLFGVPLPVLLEQDQKRVPGIRIPLLFKEVSMLTCLLLLHLLESNIFY